MAVWWITLVSTYVLCLIARKTSSKTVVEGKVDKIPKKIFATLACGILVLVSGLRNGIGDTETYRGIFNNTVSDIRFWDKFDFEGDWGFAIVQHVFKRFISEDAQFFLFICAFITIVLIFVTIYKYSGLLEIGIFTFITAGNFAVTMNGVRQYLISAILFICFPLIYEKKWYLYFPIVLIGSTIHSSALLFIPLYFIINHRAWGLTSKCLIFGGITVYICYPLVGNFIVELLQETNYGHYGTDLLSGTGGANLIRTAVYLVPLVLTYLYKNRIRENEKYFNIVVNMSILNFVFMLLANKQWIFARFCMYFSLFTILLFCWCIKYCFKNKDRRIVYYTYVILFALYFFYEMHISLNQSYLSDYIKL